MRYVIAVAAAIVLIGAVSLYVNGAKRSLDLRMKQQAKDSKPSDDPSQNLEADHEGASFEVSELEMLHINLLDLWINFRVILIPFLIVASLVIASLFERPTKSPAANSTNDARKTGEPL